MSPRTPGHEASDLGFFVEPPIGIEPMTYFIMSEGQAVRRGPGMPRPGLAVGQERRCRPIGSGLRLANC